MPYQLRFEHLLRYDVGQMGIPVPVTLRANDRVVDIAAKFDAGASDCIFEREHGMALGLGIESGTLKIFGTATGAFPAYGHMVTLSVKDVEYEAIVYFAKDVGFKQCGVTVRISGLYARGIGRLLRSAISESKRWKTGRGLKQGACFLVYLAMARC